jgi:hypothetical protein
MYLPALKMRLFKNALLLFEQFFTFEYLTFQKFFYFRATFVNATIFCLLIPIFYMVKGVYIIKTTFVEKIALLTQ